MIFADVRGSTSIAETMAPTEFAAVLQRFYATSAEVLVRHDAMMEHRDLTLRGKLDTVGAYVARA